jgi:hypothetical protein
MYPIFSEELARIRLSEARNRAERQRLVGVLRARGRADRARGRALAAADKADRASQRLIEVTLALVSG